MSATEVLAFDITPTPTMWTVMAVVGLQLVLGVAALALRPATAQAAKTTASALWTTAHQANGALLLATLVNAAA